MKSLKAWFPICVIEEGAMANFSTSAMVKTWVVGKTEDKVYSTKQEQALTMLYNSGRQLLK